MCLRYYGTKRPEITVIFTAENLFKKVTEHVFTDGKKFYLPL